MATKITATTVSAEVTELRAEGTGLHAVIQQLGGRLFRVQVLDADGDLVDEATVSAGFLREARWMLESAISDGPATL